MDTSVLKRKNEARRLRSYAVTNKALVSLFKKQLNWKIPLDSLIVQAIVDVKNDRIEFIIHSDSFESLQEGELPQVD